MRVKDQFIDKLIETKAQIAIGEDKFYIERSPSGCCDGCYFLQKQCPTRATQICCSNGGNILKLVENGR